MIHYAPYGPNAINGFDCGMINDGEQAWTDNPGRVTCLGCKAKSPGLWPDIEKEYLRSLVKELRHELFQPSLAQEGVWTTQEEDDRLKKRNIERRKEWDQETERIVEAWKEFGK